MANIKAGIMGAIGTVIVLIIELILFPIGLSFLSNLNNSEWISSADRNTLAQVPTLMIVVVLFTALGGMVGTVYLAAKG